MATGGAKRGFDRKNPHSLTYEELVPSSGWTEDENCRCLMIDLPGFKKDQVKLQVDNNGNVIASGERKVTENKCFHFQQSYKVPENSKIEETTANFEDEILYVLIPKQVTMKNAENQIGTLNINQQENEEIARKQDGEINEDDNKNGCYDDKMRGEKEFHDAAATQWNISSVLETVKEKLKEKKVIIVTAVLAFSLGVLVSHKLQSQGE